MLSREESFSAAMETSEDLFPLGPFPRHIWTHNNTPLDGLDEACHKIWKRTQRFSAELQLPPLQDALCLDFSWTLQNNCTSTLSNIVAQDKTNVTSNASTSGFTTASTTTTTASAWQSSNFPPSPIFPNHFNLSQLQVVPYSSQQILQSPYSPVVSYIPVVQSGYPLQMIQPTSPSNSQDPSPAAADVIQYPFAPSYGFSCRAGGALVTNLH